jgi:Leucine-rich repeat (LRR) protein
LGIQFFSHAEKLTELLLDSTLTTDQGLVHLASLKALRKLGLGNTSVRGEGFSYLKDLESLTQVSLGGAPVTDSGLKQLALIRNLERLSLNHSDITNEGISQLKNLKKLTHLNLAEPTLATRVWPRLGKSPRW